MSYVMLSVVGRDRAVHGAVHGSDAQRVVAALAADPETLGELEIALGRYLACRDEHAFFGDFSPGVLAEPTDAGLLLVDLVARVIVSRNSYFTPQLRGSVSYHNGGEAIGITFPYTLAGDWLISNDVGGWLELALQRRETLGSQLRTDVRTVLYGEIATYIVDELIARTAATETAATDNAATDSAATDSAATETSGTGGQSAAVGGTPPAAHPAPATADRVAEIVRDIHRRWLMTPRTELAGQSPRQCLFADFERICEEIDVQQQRWSLLGVRPPGLPQDSQAFLNAHFGSNEIIIYYDLVRYLLDLAAEMFLPTGRAAAADSSANATAPAVPHQYRHAAASVVAERTLPPRTGEINRAAQIRALEQAQQEWLHSPQTDSTAPKSPAEVIATERARLPLALVGDEAILDCDCPICQAMATDDNPLFVHYDPYHLDDEFEFSLVPNRDQWELERGIDDDWSDEPDPTLPDAAGPPSNAPAAAVGQLAAADGGARRDENSGSLTSGVWQCSYTNTALLDDMSPQVAVQVELLGIGGHLAELCEDLRQLDAIPQISSSLKTRFSHLATGVSSLGEILSAAADRFCDELADLGCQYDSLFDKCEDLERMVRDLECRWAIAASQSGDGPSGDRLIC